MRYIRAHLMELKRLRAKIGYAKVKAAKKEKLRVRIRYQLEQLRKYLPKDPNIQSPCDESTWEEKVSTPEQIEESRKAYHTIVSLFSGDRDRNSKW